LKLFKIFLYVFCTVIIRCRETFGHPVYIYIYIHVHAHTYAYKYTHTFIIYIHTHTNAYGHTHAAADTNFCIVNIHDAGLYKYLFV
jgi:hypothetical protein